VKQGKRSIIGAVIVMVSFLAGSLPAQTGSTVGKFMYRGNPEGLNGDTIHVSDTMVAMSELYWTQAVFDTGVTNTETPSIFFVIDNSGSMYGQGGTNDPNALRFSVTRSFIDTIFSKYPGAEVGLAVFGTHLLFDPADSTASGRYPFISKFPFKRKLAQYEHDTGSNTGAYVPLLKLDSMYADYGGLTGLTLLDTILDTAHSTNPVSHIDLRYVPSAVALRTGAFYSTNLTAGFDAVKSAMTVARASECSRYVILLSDGAGNRPDGTYAPADNGVPHGRSRCFMGLPDPAYPGDSTLNVPTTFTVFFPGNATLANSLGLRCIDTMTQRIRVNGYDPSKTAGDSSACNDLSNYWPINAANLMSTLTDNIWKLMCQLNSRNPIQIVINGTAVTARSGDTAFIASHLFPLYGVIDSFNIALTYSVIRNNSWVKDTTLNLKYWVRRDPGSGVWVPSMSSFDVWTWYRDLHFRYADTLIPAIVETMDSVQLCFVFDSGTALYGYSTVPVTLYNKIQFTSGSYPIDREPLSLNRVGASDTFTVKFKRQVSTTATQGDGVLQYQGASDSIIAVFRNSESVVLPLDTLRVAIGFGNETGITNGRKAGQRHGETWLIVEENSGVRIHLPEKTRHTIKVYSLAGHCMDSRLTGESDVRFTLPRGVYIVNVEGAGPRIMKRIVVMK
jgi:hypothetical protein